MISELMNDMMDEGRRQFNKNLRLRDPIAHLENQVKLMYARQEISRQQYHQLIQKVQKHQIGRGDLEILHRQAMQENNEADMRAPQRLSPAVEQRLEQLALDRVRLEDIQYEAQGELDSLKTKVNELHEQAGKARQTAQDNLPDEQAARDLLAREQELLDRAHQLEERIHALSQGVERIESLKKRLESYEADLKSLDIVERLTGATMNFREDMLVQ